MMPTVQPISASTSTSSGVTLLHSIIKLLQKSFVLTAATKQSVACAQITQKYAFAVLTNCAQSNECKNIIWKSNVMAEFTNTSAIAAAVSSSSDTGASGNIQTVLRLEKHWLTFVMSLSFSSDGQQFAMKCDGLLATLIHLYEYYQQLVMQTQISIDIQYACLLILRNLAFNQSNKSKLISNCNFFKAYKNVDVNFF